MLGEYLRHARVVHARFTPAWPEPRLVSVPLPQIPPWPSSWPPAGRDSAIEKVSYRRHCCEEWYNTVVLNAP